MQICRAFRVFIVFLLIALASLSGAVQVSAGLLVDDPLTLPIPAAADTGFGNGDNLHEGSVSHAITGEFAFDPYQNPVDGTTGLKVSIDRIFDSTTGSDEAILLGDFDAEVTYDSTCINILGVRDPGFANLSGNIDNVAGITTFSGSSTGTAAPTDLGFVATRLVGSATQPCPVTLEITSLTDNVGNPVDLVEPKITHTLLRGDARADGIITIADALFIAQYLVGSRAACTFAVDTACMHSVNAASVSEDGEFDQKTITDALFIVEYLGGLRDPFYNLAPTGTNRPPVLASIGDQSVVLGTTLSLALSASDPDGDEVNFSASPLPLPEGASLDGVTGAFTFTPDRSQIGSTLITFSANDGLLTASESITVDVIDSPPGTPTGLQGCLLDTNSFVDGVTVPITGASVSILGTGLTSQSDEQGCFLLQDIPETSAVLDIDTSTAGLAPDGSMYAGFREEIELISGVTNVVDRPFFLPRIDGASLTTVDPDVTIVVNNPNLGTTLTVPPQTAKNPDGSNFTGQLSISEVPDGLAPAALPAELNPGLLITIQPVGVTFADPVPITFPNNDELPPGEEVDIWSLDPDTGMFVVVGTGRVTPDGSEVETISGGVRAADWHFILPLPSFIDTQSDRDDDYPQKPGCSCGAQTQPTGSETYIASGNLSEDHTLAGYRSLGETRGLRFVYNSRNANPQPVIRAQATVIDRTAVPVTMSSNLKVAQVNQGAELFTDTSSLSQNTNETIRQSVQFDASTFNTGMYPYRLSLTNNYSRSSVSSVAAGSVLVNNQSTSHFGVGWTIDGVQRVYEQSDGSAVLTQGDGSALHFMSPDLPGCITQPPGVISWWPGDDNANDIADGNHGTLIGDTAFAPGKVGQAFSLDGSGDIVLVPDSNNLTIRGDITLEAWIRYDAGGASQTIVSKYESNPGGGGTAYGISLLDGQTSSSRIRFVVYQTPGGFDRGFRGMDTDISVVPEGVFTHVAGTFNLATQEMKIYVNGIEVAAPLFPDSIEIGSIFPSTSPVRLGASQLVSGAVDHYYGGLIDEAAVYNRTLTAAEIKAIFDAGSAGKCKAQPGDPGEFSPPDGDFSELLRNSDGTFTRTLEDGMQINFDAQGLQTSVVDRNGNATTYAYDAQGLLTSITDPAGLVTTLSYSGGFLTSTVDPSSRITTFQHNANGDLTVITDPDGTIRRFSYDPRHRLTSQTSKRGFVTSYEYNPFGQHVKSTLPDGSTRLITPVYEQAIILSGGPVGSQTNPAPLLRPNSVGTFTDGNGNVTQFTTNRLGASVETIDPLDRTTVIERDDNSKPVQIVSPNGRTTTMTYDERGNLLTMTEAAGTSLERQSQFEYEPLFNQVTSVTDPAGNITGFEYDTQGNLTRVINALGDESLFTYDDRGLLLASTDENVHTTIFTYDTNGNLETVTDPEGNVTRFSRDAAGNLLQVTEGVGTPEERTASSTYDALNRLLSDTDGTGATTLFRYDSGGNLIEVESPTGEIVTNTYDALNRVTRVDDPVSGITQSFYDSNGNLIRTVNALNDATVFEYDAANRLVKSIDALNGERVFTYDEHDNLLSLEDALNQTTTFAYDLLDRQILRVNPLEQETLFAYDSRDNLNNQTNPNGDVISHIYDNLSRLTVVTTPDDTIGLTYDSAGNLLSVTDNDSQVDFTYDGLNRVVTADTVDVGVQPAVTLTNAYDAVGNRTSLTDSAGGVSQYSYDNADRLTRMVTPASDTIDLGYDPAGRLRQILFPNSVTSDYQYDPQGRLDNIVHSAGANPLASFGYRYNGIGNIQSIQELEQTRQFTYDALQRLTGAGTVALPETYAYDAEGNRTVSHLSTTHRTDNANRLLEDDDYTYSYDDNGNLQTKTSKADSSVTAHTYDALNRLVQIDFPDGTAATYRYDGLGRRIEKNVDGAINRYVYDGEDILVEYDGTITLTARYSHGDQTDQPLSLERSGQTYFYQADHLGSIRKITDGTGVVVNSYDYDAYGQFEAMVEGVPNPYSFTGREKDAESGLYFYRARYYDPQMGRFISEDPIRFAGGDVNLYGYVFDNPVNFIDPSGLIPLSGLARVGRKLPSLWKCAKKCFQENLGLQATTITTNLAGAKFIPTRTKFGGDRGTSIASVVLRKTFPQRLSRAVTLRTFLIFGKKSSTKVVGGVLGRLVPGVGLGLAIYDVYKIGTCVHDCRKGDC